MQTTSGCRLYYQLIYFIFVLRALPCNFPRSCFVFLCFLPSDIGLKHSIETILAEPVHQIPYLTVEYSK